MKKTIIMMLLVISLLLSSCAETQKPETADGSTKVETSETEKTTKTDDTETPEAAPKREAKAIDDYEGQVYLESQSAAGSGGGYVNKIGRYIGEIELERIDWETKSGVPERKDTVLGRELTLRYDVSHKREYWGFQMDAYTSSKLSDEISDYCFVYYRTDTDKIVKYHYCGEPENYDRNYSSPVKPDSTEEEYIAYARQILLECAGVSAEGWEVMTTTYFLIPNTLPFYASPSYQRIDGFTYYADDSCDPNAEYCFTFYKTIGEIVRSDKMYVRMTNVGEIIDFHAISCDEAFKPYEGIAVDKAKVERAAFSVASVGSAEVEKNELYVADDALWAMVDIVYSVIDYPEEEQTTSAEGYEGYEEPETAGRPDPIIEYDRLILAVKVAELVPRD